MKRLLLLPLLALATAGCFREKTIVVPFVDPATNAEPLFPNAPLVQSTRESFHIMEFGTNCTQFAAVVATGLDVDVLRQEYNTEPHNTCRFFIIGAGTPSAERFAAFLNEEDLNRFALSDTNSSLNEVLLVRDRLDPSPENLYIRADNSSQDCRDFLNRFFAMIAELEADAVSQGRFREESASFWFAYDHIPADLNYERQSYLNRFLSGLGLVSEKFETVPTPAAWTNTPAFRLSGFRLCAVSNLSGTARWFKDEPMNILQIDEESPVAVRLRKFLEEQKPWNWNDESAYDPTLHEGELRGGGIGPASSWHAKSSGQAKNIVNFLLGVHRILVDSTPLATNAPAASESHAENAENAEN